MRFFRALAAAIVLCHRGLSAPTTLEEQEAAAEAAAVAECGQLGVMKVNKAQLPPGVDPKDVRKCLNHPEGRVREKSEKQTSNLFARECWGNRVRYGCSHGGYCYRACGPNGEWCWAATQQGFGPWERCSTWQDCSMSMACGQGNCEDCGCSC